MFPAYAVKARASRLQFKANATTHERSVQWPQDAAGLPQDTISSKVVEIFTGI